MNSKYSLNYSNKSYKVWAYLAVYDKESQFNSYLIFNPPILYFFLVYYDDTTILSTTAIPLSQNILKYIQVFWDLQFFYLIWRFKLLKTNFHSRKFLAETVEPFSQADSMMKTFLHYYSTNLVVAFVKMIFLLRITSPSSKY